MTDKQKLKAIKRLLFDHDYNSWDTITLKISNPVKYNLAMDLLDSLGFETSGSFYITREFINKQINLLRG